MNRYHSLLIVGSSLGLLGCNVEVDGQDTGLSGGGGPGGAPTSTTSAGDDTDPDGTTPDDSGDASGGDSTADGGTDTAATNDTSGDPPGTDDGDTTSGGDGSTDTSGSTGGGAPGDPLDPDLDTPEGGETCLTPGSLGECPALEVCRFHTSEQGLCESCDACGNLGAPCTEGTDCDILFSCFQGQCTNFCPLGTFACGPIEDCLDIGHPTHGVCAP